MNFFFNFCDAFLLKKKKKKRNSNLNGLFTRSCTIDIESLTRFKFK